MEENSIEYNSSTSDTENLVTSTSIDNYFTEVLIEENMQPYSVSTVLNYCKTKILNPYLRLLSIMGLRPLVLQTQETHIVLDILNYVYVLQITGFMIAGYFLQYMACFRRDRGFTHRFAEKGILESEARQHIYLETCHESLLFSFVLPSILHLMGYLDALAVFRRTDDDQLPVLIERVFLSSTNISGGVLNQRKLIKALWIFVISSAVWMVASLITVNYMMAVEEICFKWTENGPYWVVILLKILLVIGTLWQDMVQATIVSSYCLQAQLLNCYIQFLRVKLLDSQLTPLEWIRDIEEFRKLLTYFNKHMAPPVCIFTIVNMAFAISGAWWLFKFDIVDLETLQILGVSIFNVILWTIITVAPFVQAARLTGAGERFKTVGQEVRTRPFVHQDTPINELNSILTYTSSLDISAKLFNVPITAKYLCFFITFVAVLILVLGQLSYISVNWI